MARGWESKSVDDQIAAAEAAEADRTQPAGGTHERERETRTTALRLARAKALQELQTACDRRHRALLERTLEYLDAELTTRSPQSDPSPEETH